MKQCPTCQSQYTDDTLQFCLQDGSPLGVVGGSPESKTIAFGEQETVVSNRPSGQINQPQMTNPTGWNPNQYQSNPAASVPAAGKTSNSTMAVFVTVFVMLLLFSMVGIGAWLYFRGATPDDKGNLFITKSTPYPETQSNKATTANANTSIKATPATTPLITSSNNANTTVDNEQVKSEVTQRLDSWKSASESLNLDAHMNHYAPTLDYYNKKGASASVVRADKQRAYTTYSSIQINLSNLSVTPDPSGETATAVFDKEWNFSGAGNSSGKVQQQLKLKKIGGQWLITGERDLKVYYTR